MKIALYKNEDEELERKAKTLIVLGMEMLIIQQMQKDHTNYETPFIKDMQELVNDTIPQMEQQYYYEDNFVRPIEEVDSVKYIIKNLENAIEQYEDTTYSKDMHQSPEDYEDDY